MAFFLSWVFGGNDNGVRFVDAKKCGGAAIRYF